MREIKVLNKGLVRLVDHMGSDLSVVRAARVSYDAAWRAGLDEKSDHKLIRYLWRNNHSTPFEAVTFTFEIIAPIFVFRQWHRHRTQSYNELSARYRELPESFYIPELDYIGHQSAINKQARELMGMTESEIEQRAIDVESYINQCRSSFQLYRDLLASGWPRELARMVLPLSTYSHMFTTMNLLNLFKFLSLRLHKHAQYEIRIYAEAMLEMITDIVPECVSAFKETQ